MTKPNPIEGLQLTVAEGALTVSMAGQKDNKLTTADFAEKPLTVALVTETCFYVASNEEGLMERCVSSTIADRATVAAMVGNWVAEGFNVQRVTRKELKKFIAKLDTLAKEASQEDAAKQVAQAVEAAKTGGATTTGTGASAEPPASTGGTPQTVTTTTGTQTGAEKPETTEKPAATTTTGAEKAAEKPAEKPAEKTPEPAAAATTGTASFLPPEEPPVAGQQTSFIPPDESGPEGGPSAEDVRDFAQHLIA